MSKPGEGESMTLGEAAAYARGRAEGLREAAHWKMRAHIWKRNTVATVQGEQEALAAARREGAEAMREAADKALLQEGYIYLAELVRALPLPQEAGDE